MSQQTKSPQITIETISPHKASTLLGTMDGNRPLRSSIVRRYAREMATGKWLLNGEAIKITRSGRLIDGQHRLNAVIMANVEVQMCVVRGVDDGAMVTLDTGIGRSYHDANIIRGKETARGVGPIARWWCKYELGSPTNSQITPTHQDLDDVVERHPSIIDSAQFIPKLKTVQSFCVSSVQGFVHAYTSESWDRDSADLFMHSLNDGTALQRDDPVYHLRRRLVESDRERAVSTTVLALTIKAWNAWISNERLGNLRWQSEGEKTEAYPRFLRDSAAPNARGLQARKVAASGDHQHRSSPDDRRIKRRPVAVA